MFLRAHVVNCCVEHHVLLGVELLLGDAFEQVFELGDALLHEVPSLLKLDDLTFRHRHSRMQRGSGQGTKPKRRWCGSEFLHRKGKGKEARGGMAMARDLGGELGQIEHRRKTERRTRRHSQGLCKVGHLLDRKSVV